VVNFARKLEIDPEIALRISNQKFIKRFKKIEEMSKNISDDMSELSITQLEDLWNKAKKE
jgi:uncharacterized protein YabN with tetrapyrrole methylase and pyrophosphatase domain